MPFCGAQRSPVGLPEKSSCDSRRLKSDGQLNRNGSGEDAMIALVRA